jgi:transcription initiation factor TFIID subunit 9B
MSLATQTNAQPLPSVPEVFGVRLPPEGERLTSVDFNLVPNKPPPTIAQYDEEIEEIEEDEEDEEDEDEEEEEDEDMEPAVVPPPPSAPTAASVPPPPMPVAAGHTPSSDVEMAGIEDVVLPNEQEEGSDDDDDGLFAGGDDDEEVMEEVVPAPAADGEAENGFKRKLVEDDDYD